MTQAQRKAAYGFAGPTAVAIREKVGQGLAIAALGGFRGLAANALMLQAHGAWEEQQWVRVRASLELATVLQPRVAVFWDTASWHLAWNAAVAAERFSGEKSETRRKMEARRWVEAGRDLLERGTKAVPERALLYQRLGDLYCNDWGIIRRRPSVTGKLWRKGMRPLIWKGSWAMRWTRRGIKKRLWSTFGSYAKKWGAIRQLSEGLKLSRERSASWNKSSRAKLNPKKNEIRNFR